MPQTEGCSLPQQDSAGRTDGCRYCEAAASSVATSGHAASSEAGRVVPPVTEQASASQLLASVATVATWGDAGDLSCSGRCVVGSSSTSVAHCRCHCRCTSDPVDDLSRSDEGHQVPIHLLASTAAVVASSEVTASDDSARSVQEASRG